MQEFHLSQTYNEGLLKLQSKEYDKARELLESVLKDPLISAAQVLIPSCLLVFMCFYLLVVLMIMLLFVVQEDGKASDSHLLQLRLCTLWFALTVL